MDTGTRSHFHPSQALPSTHVHYESGRRAGVVALFFLAGIVALGGLITLAVMTPLGKAMAGAVGLATAIPLFGFLYLVSLLATSFAARGIFSLAMKGNSAKGSPTGFLGGMSVVADLLLR